MALDFLAGCFGGIAGVVVGYPLDTIKVHLQIQDTKSPKFRGVWHCFTTIVRQDSPKGLFKGMTSPLSSVAVINAITFGIYGNVVRGLPANWNHTVSVFVAGATAGLVQSIVVSPMELAKCQMQIQPRTARHKSPWDCLVQIHRIGSWKGVFRGYGVTVARDVPAFGLYFASYEWLCQSLQDDATGQAGPVAILIAGGLGGIVSWVSTYPLDVVKTRVQADALTGLRKYGGAADCFVQCFQQEGLQTFSRGLSSTVLRAFPTNAATFLAVSLTLQLLGPKLDNDKVHFSIGIGDTMLEPPGRPWQRLFSLPDEMTEFGWVTS